MVTVEMLPKVPWIKLLLKPLVPHTVRVFHTDYSVNKCLDHWHGMGVERLTCSLERLQRCEHTSKLPKRQTAVLVRVKSGYEKLHVDRLDMALFRQFVVNVILSQSSCK